MKLIRRAGIIEVFCDCGRREVWRLTKGSIEKVNAEDKTEQATDQLQVKDVNDEPKTKKEISFFWE